MRLICDHNDSEATSGNLDGERKRASKRGSLLPVYNEAKDDRFPDVSANCRPEIICANFLHYSKLVN